MTNINKEGNYIDALRDLEQYGGTLFPPKNNSSKEPTVLRIGDKTITYWPEGSKPEREKLINLAEKLRIPKRDLGNPWNLTSGRLARLFLDKVIKAKNFDADPHPKKYARYYGTDKYLPMAVDGSHWHFEYVNVQEPCYAIELDLKSAYFTSLSSFETLFLHEKIGFRPDGGALDRLRKFAPILNEDKAFRLQLLGILAQHENKFDKREKDGTIVRQVITSVVWGSAFNATHEAIKRVHTAMVHSSQMLGQYLIRSHTDCLLIRADCPEDIENRVVNYLTQKGFTLACKQGKIGYRFGLSKFWDLNTGFIGRYPLPISQAEEVKERMEEDGIDLKEIYKPIPEPIVKRWEHWLV